MNVSGARTKAVEADFSGFRERKDDSDSDFSSLWNTKDWTEADSTMDDCLDREALEWVSRAIASSSASSNDRRHSSAGVSEPFNEAEKDSLVTAAESICVVMDELDCICCVFCSC